MLKFFGRIRRQMLNGKKWSSYLVYAIGEILLVVLGILIALQVNNWNENRKARLTEKSSLIALVEEFQKNRDDLREHISWKQNVQTQWDTFFVTISNEQLPLEKKAIRRPIASYVNIIISNSVLNSLLTSGKIDNLRSDSLRYMLTTWQDVVAHYQQFQSMHKDFVNNELMPFENKLFPNYSNTRYGFDYSFHSTEKSAELFLEAYNDMDYQNILLRNFYWINIQLRNIVELEEKMNQVITLLENEIEGTVDG